MSEVVGYELQVRRSGEWQTVAAFDAGDIATARIGFERHVLDGGADAVRWIEETLDAEGLFRTRTLGMRGAPVNPSRAPAVGQVQKATRPTGAPATAPVTRTAPAARKPKPKPNGQRTAGPASNASARRSSDSKPRKAANRSAFAGLLGFLYTTIKEQLAVGTAPAVPPPPEPVARRGDLMVYEDETGLPTVDLFTSDTIVREFHNFVLALDGLESTAPARENARFVQGISLFTIGVMFAIDEQIDLFSQRGRTVIHACLGRLVDPSVGIGHFVESLERYLRDPDSLIWIRAGSRCFRHYRAAALGDLNREFGEAFGVYERLEPTVGGRVKVGILFTDIVGSTALTGELGDDLAQEVVDHHDKTVEAIARKFGGRRVKHLGDGLMLCFGSAAALAGCATAVIDTMKGLANRPEVPGYRIRCGGHFGEAISKADDFFGTTVQLAARVAASAAPNEARVSAAMIEGDHPAFRRFQDCGASALKGFERPVALASYA